MVICSLQYIFNINNLAHFDNFRLPLCSISFQDNILSIYIYNIYQSHTCDYEKFNIYNIFIFVHKFSIYAY